MTPRERKIAIVAGSMVGAVVLYKVSYSRLIQPLFEIKDRIAEKEAELADVFDERDRIDDARLTYKKLVERTGGTDAAAVVNEVRAKLDELLVQSNLSDRGVTPRPPTRDSKTGLQTVRVDLSGTGSLESVMGFLKQCYELPYVSRFGEVKLNPQRSRQNKQTAESVKLDAVFEVWVLPEDRHAEVHPDFAGRPAGHIKHSGEPLALVWERRPFDEYVKPVQQAPPTPPVVNNEPKTTRTHVDPKPEGDPDRDTKRVAMSMLYGVNELLLVNDRGRRGGHEREYIAVGGKLDGGDLLAVHPYGGLVRKEKGEFFYPVGKRLVEAVPVSAAQDYPELLEWYEGLPPELHKSRTPPAPAADGDGQTPPEAEPSDNGASTGHGMVMPTDQGAASPPSGPQPTGGASQAAPTRTRKPASRPDTSRRTRSRAPRVMPGEEVPASGPGAAAEPSRPADNAAAEPRQEAEDDDR